MIDCVSPWLLASDVAEEGQVAFRSVRQEPHIQRQEGRSQYEHILRISNRDEVVG
jgi:hypothetical protein